MIDKRITLDLMEFVEQNILPRYNSFDKAHNVTHAMRVINRSVELAKRIGADVNMAYAIAAYHDLGLEGQRAIHHLTSGKILAADARLKKWFSDEQRRIMREAVEDHRASASRSPRSIYGKIVAEADRDLEPETVIRRTIEFGLSHEPPGISREMHWQRFMKHMQEKYSQTGYIKLWIPGSANEQHLARLRNLIEQPDELRKLFDRIFDEECIEQ